MASKLIQQLPTPKVVSQGTVSHPKPYKLSPRRVLIPTPSVVSQGTVSHPKPIPRPR